MSKKDSKLVRLLNIQRSINEDIIVAKQITCFREHFEKKIPIYLHQYNRITRLIYSALNEKGLEYKSQMA